MAVCRSEILKLKMDFESLISCIECHKEARNAEVIIETLKTIVNICAEEEMAKDAFRDVGGLDFLLQFLIGTDEVLILEYSLNALAFVVDGNVHSQMHLTKQKVFKILRAIFDKKTYPLNVVKNAVVLFSTLLFQNKIAQDLIYEEECLLSLMNLYKSYIPIASCDTSPEDSDSLEIWFRVNSSLCFAVNNPMNDKNQAVCSALFPLSLRVIETSSNPAVIDASSLFLSLTIANNEKNQTAFAEFDGFLILKRSLNKTFEQIHLYLKECNNIVSKGTLQIANSLISIISACVLDHQKNAELCGKIGIVSLMIKLLDVGVLNPQLAKKVILALGHCVDACCKNKFVLLDTANFDTLLKKNLETDDQELHAAAKYLLQVCLHEFDTAQEQDFFSDVELEENPSKIGIAGKNSMPNLRHKFKNMVREKGSSSSKALKQSQNLSSHKGSVEDQRFRKPVTDFTVNRKSKTEENGIYFPKNEKNFESSSESDSSLQSAGHFYQQQRKKFNRNLKKIRSSDFKEGKCIDKSDNYGASDEESSLSIRSKVNCHNRKNSNGHFGIPAENFSERHHSICNNYDQKNYKIPSSNVKYKAGNENFGPPIDSNVFSRTNHNSDSYFKCPASPRKRKLARCKDFRNKPNKHDNLESEVYACEKNSCTKVSNSHRSATFCKHSSHVNACSPLEKRATDTSEQQINDAKFSARHFSFKLEEFPGPYSLSKKKDRYSQISESGCSRTTLRVNAPGCMEVIVLPGTACCEHKLAAQFEQLKVCPISKS